MKITAKKITSTILAFILSCSAFAYETGGLISNDTKLKDNKATDLTLDQINEASLWFRTALSEDGTSYFVAEGSFKSEYDDGIPNDDDKLALTLDVSLFKLAVQRTLELGEITFVTGRFFNSDASGFVFAQNADGLKIDYNAYSYRLAFYGAYTGLLNAKNITILGPSSNDALDPKKLYVLASKYAVAGLTLSFPSLFANQTLSLEGFGTFGLESTKLNRFYGTLALSGPLFSPVFYDLSSTFGFSKFEDTDKVKGNLTKASVSAYPDFKSMSVSLNGIYASGKQGPFEKFQGFTSMTAITLLDDSQYSGLALAGLSATIKPIDQLILRAAADLIFSAEEEIEYTGLQYSAGLDCQIVSDVSFGATFAQLIHKDDSSLNETQIRITAKIAF